MKLALFLLPLIAAIVTSALAEERFQFTPDLLKMRDPFKRPNFAVTVEGAKSDLESFPADKFELIGVMTGPKQLRAMVRAPNGKTYFIDHKSKIGMHGGTVKKISTQVILVREKIMNVIGQEEVVDTEIKMPPESKRDLTSTGKSNWQ
jgi:Tfp pilus assembly protein PilP